MLSNPVRLALCALALVAVSASNAGAQTAGPQTDAGKTAAPGESASSWQPRLILGAGAGVQARGSAPSDAAVLVGMDVSRPSLLGSRLRLRIDYLASYRADGVFGSSLQCSGCSALTQGLSASVVLTPFPNAAWRPYALAGVAGVLYSSEDGEGVRGRGAEAGLVTGLGIEARLSARADAYVELRNVGVGGGMLPLTGGLRWRF